MPNWIYLALVSGLLYGCYHFFIRLASAQMHQVLAAIVLQATALTAGGFLLLLMKSAGHAIQWSQKGIILAMVAGLSVGIAEILAFYAFSSGAAVSQAVPIIVGVTVASASAYGIIFLSEALRWPHIVGGLLIVSGIILISSRT